LLAGFRGELYRCLTRRGDALFCLADAVLCGPVRVSDLARLSLVPEFGRGHGALYDAVNAGRVEFGRLRRALAGLPLPAWPDGRIRLAADVSNWLRPEAEASPGRLFCHVHGRGKNNRGQVIPGWPDERDRVEGIGCGPHPAELAVHGRQVGGTGSVERVLDEQRVKGVADPRGADDRRGVLVQREDGVAKSHQR
jgi:hypothetical protein